MQGQFKWEWKKSWYWIILVVFQLVFYFIGVLVGFMNTLVSIGMLRPIGFGIATLTFGILTWLILNELPDTRTIICLILSVIIIILQLSHLIKI